MVNVPSWFSCGPKYLVCGTMLWSCAVICLVSSVARSPRSFIIVCCFLCVLFYFDGVEGLAKVCCDKVFDVWCMCWF